jgi:hypothetical protein
MGADWGLYTALRGTDNWQQRRADKQMNMLALEKRAQISEANEQKRLKSEEYLNKYMSELQNMEVLTEDKDRVAAAEKNARQNVIKGIKSYNGDVSRFMSSGGLTELNNYKNSLMQSEEVKNAMQNKVNLKNFLDAQAKGLYVHKVKVPVEVTDENGNKKTIMKPMTFQEQFQLFKEGKINKLEYTAGEKEVNVTPFAFSQAYKDPRNKGSKDNIVTASNIYNYAKGKGASEQYARDLAEDYVAKVKAGGETWKWKAMDDYELALQQAQMNKLRGGSGGSGGQTVLNQFQAKKESLLPGQSFSVPPSGFKFMSDILGLSTNKTTGQTLSRQPLAAVNFNAKDKDGKYENYDLTKAYSIDIINKDGFYKGPDNKMYLKANTIFPADDTNGTPSEEGIFYANQNSKVAEKGFQYTSDAEDFGIKNPDLIDKDAYRGIVYIPLESYMSQWVLDEYNKERGVRSNFEGAGVSYDDAAQMESYNQKIQVLQSQANMSENEILEISRMNNFINQGAGGNW